MDIILNRVLRVKVLLRPTCEQGTNVQILPPLSSMGNAAEEILRKRELRAQRAMMVRVLPLNTLEV